MNTASTSLLLSLVSTISLAASVPAFAQGVALVGQPTFSGDCGQGSKLEIVQLSDVASVELAVVGVKALANAQQPSAERNCVASAVLQAPPGYKLAPGTLKYEGVATITGAADDADITARYYLTGTDSLVGYQSFTGAGSQPFTVATSGQPTAYTQCGGTAEFNFMADVSAYHDSGAAGRAEVRVQRGDATIGVSQDTPVFQCGVKMVPCW